MKRGTDDDAFFPVLSTKKICLIIYISSFKIFNFKMWFILLILIGTAAAFPTNPTDPSTTAFFDYDSALGYACHSNTNCGGLVGNSMCLNGICVCQPGYIPEGIMRCIYAPGMNNNLSFSSIECEYLF